jgi:dTDP-4-dehydrorhamnose reductase
MNLTAADVQRLLNDDTFKEVIHRVRQEQIDIFVNSNRWDIEEREDAKHILRAMDKVVQALESVKSDQAIREKRKLIK